MKHISKTINYTSKTSLASAEVEVVVVVILDG
jgi:hypothetical protein